MGVYDKSLPLIIEDTEIAERRVHDVERLRDERTANSRRARMETFGGYMGRSSDLRIIKSKLLDT